MYSARAAITSADLSDLFTRVNSEAFALLWDAHHTFAFSHEDPEAVKGLERYIVLNAVTKLA